MESYDVKYKSERDETFFLFNLLSAISKYMNFMQTCTV